MKKNEIILYQKLVLINLIVIGISLLFIIITTYGCNEQVNPVQPNQDDKGDYSIAAKYDSIRSYPNGGGIFIVYINTDKDFSGTVKLKVEGESLLNATLSRHTLDNKQQIVEIMIKPSNFVELDKYTIELIATHGGKEKKVSMKVDVIQWEEGEIETPLSKRDDFKSWLMSNYPKYNGIFNGMKTYYHTYPQILIVEHYTFLTDEYEVRLCYHVMIEPYQWSKIWIRRRNTAEAEFAAVKDIEGEIFSIPVSEYPLLFGY